MKIKSFLIIVVLFVAVVIAAVPHIDSADARYYDGRILYEVTDEDLSFMEEYGIAYDLTAEMVVELEGLPIAEQAEKIEKYGSINGFLTSEEGKKTVEDMENEIERVKYEAVRLIGKNDLDFGYDYTTALYGFSLTTTVGNMFTLRQLEGVKRAYLTHQVVKMEAQETLQESEADILMYSSGSMIGTGEAYELGYTGEGTLVAILDSGIDVSHEAFQGEVPNPLYTKEEIKQLITSVQMSSMTTSENVYKSQKIPYAYDYADNDNNVIGTSDHGMHVAGIVGANAGKITGVAYDAQLAIMKVFSDDGYSYTDDVIAALDDALKLGADSINMSLGLSAGLLQANESVAEMYDRIYKSGAVLCVAMGNDSYQGIGNISGNNLPEAANPDYGLTATPASYLSSLAVASVENNKIYTTKIDSNGKSGLYVDTATEKKDQLLNLSGKELEYVAVGNYGAVSDYNGINVVGKVALVMRGEISFTDKVVNAANAGAIAVLVYDNVYEDVFVNMQIDNRMIPSGFISREYGEFLKEQSNKVLIVGEGITDFPGGGQISSFSTRGCTSDLRLKPEISAPGGNIYSSVANNSYAYYSGTSMASPQVAGSAAVIRQYLDEKYPEMSDPDKTILTRLLMMSTADPITNTNGVYYSPRSQGAGLLSVINCIETAAFLRVENSTYAKCELGASTEGYYVFDFYVTNMTDLELKYSVKTTVLADETQEYEGKLYVTLSSRELGGEYAAVTVEGLTNGKVVVPASGETKLTVTVRLTERGKELLDSEFENGTFVEGYIQLIAEENASVDLSMVYMGFYGNWLQGTAIEQDIFSEEMPLMLGSAPLLIDIYSGNAQYLGLNNVSGRVDASKIYYSNKLGETARLSFILGLKRSVNYINITITDESGNTVYNNSIDGASKSFYYANSGSVLYVVDGIGWDGCDENGKPYPSGSRFTCTVEVTPECGVYGDNSQNIWTYEIEIDNEKPVLESYEVVKEEDRVCLNFKLSDNADLQCAMIFDYTAIYIFDDEAFDEVGKGESTEYSIDITGLAQSLVEYGINPSKIKLMVYDMAYNYIDEEIVIGPQILKLDDTVEIGVGGSFDIGLKCYPLSYDTSTLEWKSSNKSVVSVENGIITGVSEGTAVVTVSSISGLSTSCTVTVRGVADTGVVLSDTTKQMILGSSFTLSATIYPVEATNKKVTYTVSDETVLSVSEEGNVVAIGVGSAVITATTRYGNSAVCYVTVEPVYAQSVITGIDELKLIIGESEKIEAEVMPENTTYKELIWISSDTGIVIADNGSITAVGVGDAEIRVVSKDGKAEKRILVTVLPREVQAIETGGSVGLELGDSTVLSYRLIPEDATYREISFSVENESIVSLSQDGEIKGLKVGKTTVTMTAHNGVSTVVTVIVSPVSVQSLNLSSRYGIIFIGETVTLSAEVYPENATYKNIIWSSADNSIATVSPEGVVSAVGEGSTVIIASSVDGVTAEYNVEVRKRAVSAVVINAARRSLNIGDSVLVAASVLPENSSIRNVEWSVDNEEIISVNENGIVTALKAGSATLTATVDGISQSIVITVVPNSNSSVWIVVLAVLLICVAVAFALCAVFVFSKKRKKNKSDS